MRLLSIGLAMSLSLAAMGCGGDDDLGDTGGPVPADEAQIEITFTDDGSSFVGDREVLAGVADIVFANESSVPVTLGAFGYNTGSDELAAELAFLQEGQAGVPSGVDPTTPAFDTGLMEELQPGSHTLTIDLRPGTYIFDAATGDVMTSGLWRVAVIEVVAE